MSDRIWIKDDGTLDTVLVCKGCGAEARYCYEPVDWLDSELAGHATYDQFVQWAIEDFDSDHDCAETEADHD